VREYLAKIGSKGGKATSEAKRRAAQQNWKKAQAALRKKRSTANEKLSDRAERGSLQRLFGVEKGK
jgi:hypothetical protein